MMIAGNGATVGKDVVGITVNSGVFPGCVTSKKYSVTVDLSKPGWARSMPSSIMAMLDAGAGQGVVAVDQADIGPGFGKASASWWCLWRPRAVSVAYSAINAAFSVLKRSREIQPWSVVLISHGAWAGSGGGAMGSGSGVGGWYGSAGRPSRTGLSTGGELSVSLFVLGAGFNNSRRNKGTMFCPVHCGPGARLQQKASPYAQLPNWW